MRGIGIDITQISRFEKKKDNLAFLALVFTLREREICFGKNAVSQCLASRFAAKEAYMKAIGQGWTSNAQFHEIEVIHDAHGKPYIALSGSTLAYYTAQNFSAIHLSISHSHDTAVAVAIVL